jgi:hypothetical protein
MSKEQSPRVPPEREETARQRILETLRQGPLTPKEISRLAGVSERVLAEQLEHLRKSLRAQEKRLEVIPASCRQCGFAFAKREHLTTPGRCPVCKSTRIAPPRFGVR